MFQDQLTRNSQSALSWYIGWEKYVIFVCLLLGLTLSVAIGQLIELNQLESFHTQTDTIISSVETCAPLRKIATYMIIVVGLHLVSLCALRVLRDRSVSLQDRPTLISKIVAILGCIGGSVTAIVFCGLLAKELADYHTFNTTFQLSGIVLNYCPSLTSYFFTLACLLLATVLLSSLFHLLASTWIIYQRAVFLSPPPGTWEDPEEIKALNWICTEDGDVIPTIYMLPPSVHRQHREVNFCMLYSHGNAMDLADTVYTLRALAETFDCAVMGYEYPGYGMCSGSTSESRCYAAIAAAFQTLIEYHKLQPRQIILYGRSLGTGPSTHFASRQGKDLGGLILQSPLCSVLRTVFPLKSSLPMDMFCSIDKIGLVEVPTFILHGRRDTMVPFTHGEMLWKQLKGIAKQPPLWLDEASHNDMPRPWVVTEDHIPDETEQDYAEKLRRNKESRVFIQRCREYLQVVRQTKESLDHEDALARAERKAKKEARLAEEAREREMKRDSEATTATVGLPGNTPGNSSQAAIELQAIELAVMNGVSATGLVHSSNDDDGGPSTYTGPIHVTGGKAGEAQFKHLYQNGQRNQVPTLREALGGDVGNTTPRGGDDVVTSHGESLSSSTSNHATPKREGDESEHLISGSGRPTSGTSAGSGTGNKKHARQGSLRFSDHHLSPSRAAGGEISNAPNGQLRSAQSSVLELDSTLRKGDTEGSMLIPESPDASRRPSLTENMLSQSNFGLYASMHEASQVGSITYNPRSDKFHIDRDRMNSRLDRADSRFGDEQSRFDGTSRLDPLGESSRIMTDHRRDRDRDHHLRDRADSRQDFSRTMAPEVSRFGPDTTQKLHSVAVRHGPSGHSPQSQSRSLSLSHSMQSPSSFYAPSTTLPPTNLHPLTLAPSGASASGTGNQITPSGTGSPSPALTSHPSNTHLMTTHLSLTPGGQPSSSPSTPVQTAKVPSVSGSPSSAFTIQPATILVPNPQLVPLSMVQLQELMDALKSRERIERETIRQRERESRSERERDRMEQKDDSSSGSSSATPLGTTSTMTPTITNPPPSSNSLRKPPAHFRDGGTSVSGGTRESSVSSRRRHPHGSSSSGLSTQIAAGRGSPSPPLPSPLTPTHIPAAGGLGTGEVRVEIADYSSPQRHSSIPTAGERKSSRAANRTSTSSTGNKKEKSVSSTTSGSGGNGNGSPNNVPLIRQSSSSLLGSPPSVGSPPSNIRVQIHTGVSGGITSTTNRPPTSNSPPTHLLGAGRASPPTTTTTSSSHARVHVGSGMMIGSVVPNSSPSTNQRTPGIIDEPEMDDRHTGSGTVGLSNARHTAILRSERGVSGSGVDSRTDRRDTEQQQQSRGAIAGGGKNTKDSRMSSQHRASVSEYDHTSLMSRSRSGTSRSRWPYSLTAAEAAEENEEEEQLGVNDVDSLVGQGTSRPGDQDAEYDDIEEESGGLVEDHSTLQLADETTQKNTGGSGSMTYSSGARSPVQHDPAMTVLPATPVTQKNSSITKNVVVLPGPNNAAAIVAKRAERASLRESQIAQMNAVMLAATISRGSVSGNGSGPSSPPNGRSATPSESSNQVAIDHVVSTFQPVHDDVAEAPSNDPPMRYRTPDPVVASILQPIADRDLTDATATHTK